MRLYLIRHGESEGNLQKLIYGSSDHPLTPKGIAQAKEVRQKLNDLPIAHCYSSTLSRAVRTAEICFSHRNIPITSAKALCEQHMGEWEDMSIEYLTENCFDEFSAMMTDWTVNPPPGGESFDEVYKRVTEFVDKIVAANEDAAIVAHNGPLSMITVYLLGLPKSSVECFYYFHGCYSVIAIDNGYMKKLNTLEYFNK